MSMLGRFHARFRQGRFEREMDDELRFHLESMIRDNIRAGMDPEQARRVAQLDFGGLDLTKEGCRDTRRLAFVDTLWRDLHFALRIMRRSPGFTAAAVVTLALGIGANAAIFGVVNAVLFRPLPGIEDIDRLVQVFRRSTRGGLITNVSYPNYKDWRDQNRVFSGLAAYRSLTVSLNPGNSPERVRAALVSGNYFEVLGVKPALGRTFLPEEDAVPGAHPVAVVSWGLWQRRLISERGPAGKTIEINRQPFLVIGVARRGFQGTELGRPIEVWMPMMMETSVWPGGRDFLTERNWSLIQVVGRLRPRVSVKQAQTDMDIIARGLESAYPKENGGIGVGLYPRMGLYPFERGKLGAFGAVLMVVVGLVLLIACANVANLLLARAVARRKEIGVRLALGAGRLRLIQQILVENVLLALFGGAAGVLGALWGTGLLARFAVGASFFPETDYRLDGSVFCFAALLSFLTGVMVGIIPALKLSKVDPVPVLREAGSAPGGRTGPHSLLVVSQIALSLILLSLAALLAGTLRDYLSIDPGFEAKSVLHASLDLGPERYSEPQGRLLFRDLLDKVRALPGVQSASLADVAPIAGGSSMTTILDYGHGPVPGLFDLPVNFTVVAPGYFRTLGIQLSRGRDVADSDAADAPAVAVINETMARGLWPGADPIGKTFIVSLYRRSAYQVVGVVKDVRYSLVEAPGMAMYLPFAQHYQAQMTLLVRTSANSLTLLPSIRNEVRGLDKNLAVFDTGSLSDNVRNTLKPLEASAAIIGFFALTALVLAAVGIYGVISYAVARRTGEIGVRMALGAERGDVLRLVMGQGMLLVCAGVAIGAVMALGITRILSSLANQIVPLPAFDPVVFLAVVLLLLGVALIAAYLPARRATKVDLVSALRFE